MNPKINKILFLFLLMMFSVFHSFAQNRYIDSLQEILDTKQVADTTRMELQIDMGNALAADHPAMARQKYASVYSAARKAKDHYYQGMAMSGMGRLFHPENADSAMYFYLLADSLFRLDPSQEAKESVATNKSSIAEVERGRNHFEAAIKTFLEAISIMEKSNARNKWLVLGVLYSDVGSVYHDLGQFSKVLEYDLKALNTYKKSPSDPSYIVIAELFVAGDYKDLNQPEQTRDHIEKAQSLAKKINSTDLLYRVYSSWGGYYQKTEAYTLAISAFKKAMGYAKKSKNLFREMNCNRLIGFVYRDMKSYRESVASMQKALLQVRLLQNKLLEAELLKNLALVQSKQGNNGQAVGYYQDYIQLSDSLNEEATKRKINDIENKYQAGKKQDSILVLKKNNQLQKVALKQKGTLNIALVTGCVLLLMVAGLSYVNFKHKHRLFLQKEELHSQQISELQKEKKLLAAQSLMKGQEEERSRLARDLHDGVGGLLSGVKLSMSTIKGNVFFPEENARSFEKVIEQLDWSISELRRVSHNMMPEALIKYGLKEALENYCENLNISGKINVLLQTYGIEQRMEQSAEIVIYRIVQELLNNVIKHAEATKVLIQLVREDGRFNLTVEDDGKGFDMQEKKSGAGLANIKARIDYLNGEIDIVSKQGEGTSVHIEGYCAS